MSESASAFYCRDLCPFIDEQLHFIAGTEETQLPDKMCFRVAALGLRLLAENIISHQPESTVVVEHGYDEPDSEWFESRVSAAAIDYDNLAGSCVKRQLYYGTEKSSADSVREVAENEIIEILSESAKSVRLSD